MTFPDVLCFRAGTFGAMVEYGLERKVSEHSSLAVSMSVGVPTGVMLKIKYVSSARFIVWSGLCGDFYLFSGLL